MKSLSSTREKQSLSRADAGDIWAQGWEEHWFRSQTDLALAPGDFLTSCVTLGSFGILSLGFLICKVGIMILTSQGKCEKAAKALAGGCVCVLKSVVLNSL